MGLLCVSSSEDRWHRPRIPEVGVAVVSALELIAEHWDGLLRLAGSLKFGHVAASLLVGKLSASGRQNTLATALEESGPCDAPSTPPTTWPIRTTGARSPASSTKANPGTRCAGTCSTRTRA